ncbi:MAG: DEAD/DEAH box helicase [Acidobacteria bacterium]|nr:DEAD/DEAH box helicase [Acidobacteriota bacterium]
MTSSQPSASDSASFDLLHERVRRWIWDQHWSELRDVQEAAIRTILRGDGDAIITAATAAGKTEAAFLPICSTMVDADAAGVQTLYIGPLKALINDQWRRLDGLCESLDIAVHRWHGDVTASARQKLIREPNGILLITPESLEAMFVRRGSDVARIFAALRFVVIDELHAFIGNERGMQLQSLLHRLERVLHRTVRRIGLSATLGDINIAADFLRPPNRRASVPAIVESSEGGSGVKLRIFGFRGDDPAIGQHLFRNLRGANNLVFANRRATVELYADMLARMCEAMSLPQEFMAHHGSLSRELRFDVEDQLKRGDRPLTVICTSTLEMGIDIGAVTSVAQIGPPPSVASLRQRLGRSGRRGDPAILRVYIEESEVTEKSSAQDAMRVRLVETVAMINLLLRKWSEPPPSDILHGSTFVQQLLSLIAQYGGVTPADAYAMLCDSGPFGGVTKTMYMGLLRALQSRELVEQQRNGDLHLGALGERLVNKYDFYTAFISPDEYRLVAAGSSLGTLPILTPIGTGSFLIFAGRRWKVMSVDSAKKVIDLIPAGGGRVPVFDSSGRGMVHDRVRREMLAVYRATETPAFLDATAADLLREGRESFLRFGLDRTAFVHSGSGALYFPWYGDRSMNTIVQQLLARGVDASAEGPAIVAQTLSVDSLREAISACDAERPVDVLALAATVENREEEKWDEYLDEDTLNASYASRRLTREPTPAYDPESSPDGP